MRKRKVKKRRKINLVIQELVEDYQLYRSKKQAGYNRQLERDFLNNIKHQLNTG